MLNKKREKMVAHENRFCLEGVCPSQFFIFPGQTGTATSSPVDRTTSQSNMNIVNTMLWMKNTTNQDNTQTDAEELLRRKTGISACERYQMAQCAALRP